MKRYICILLVVLLAMSAAACANSTQDIGNETPAFTTTDPAPEQTPAQATETDLATTPQALNALIERFAGEGDDYGVYCAALKLTQINPGDTQAYLSAADALLRLVQTNLGTIDELLAQGAQSEADAEAVIAWAQSARADFSLTLPFTPDYATASEMNTQGTTAGNLTSAMKVNGEWREGFVTSQAGWIYFVRIDENFAIYKMRADGSDLARIGAARGFSLNVVGDWIYYVNLNDGSTPYKMRTDGSMSAKLSDDGCGFLSVSGEWMYYDSGVLYRQNILSGEKTVLVDRMTILPCVSGDYVYYCVKSEQGGFWRIPVDGGVPEKLLDAMVGAYCIKDGWIYYIASDHPAAVRRINEGGGESETIYKGNDVLSALNFVKEGLYVSSGRYLDEDGVLIGTVIFQIGIETGEIQSAIDARTEPLCAAEGCLFYTEYNEGMAWHALNPVSGEELSLMPKDMAQVENTAAEPSASPAVADGSSPVEIVFAPETSGFLAPLDALLAQCGVFYDEINKLLALGYANADAGQVAEWADQNRAAYRIALPLRTGEINAVGITAGNLTNAAKFNGWWSGGFVTWQGSWVYLARPDENFAIYRMRADTSDYQRMGNVYGSSLNTIGQWLYFINAQDGDKPYRMRLDGRELQKLSDDSCAFLSVSGDSLYYHNGNDDGCLYRVNIDGSESMKLNDVTTMFCCVYGDWVYYQEKKSDGGLYRVSIDGGEKQLVATGSIWTYCVEEDWVYYLDLNNRYCILRVHGDGSGNEMYYPCPMTLNGFNYANGMLVLPYNQTYQEDGFTVSEKMALVDPAPDAQPRDYFEDTPLVFTGPDGWIYYMRYAENLAWYAMDREGNISRIG